MKEIKAPYSKMDLLLASLDVNKKFEEDESLPKKLESSLDAIQNCKHDMKDAAEYLGIPLEMLVNSPNMESLLDSYRQSVFERILQSIKDCGFTDKEAWAIAVLGLNPELIES